MEVNEPKGYLLIDVEDDFYTVCFRQINTFPMEVQEIDIQDVKLISSSIDELELNPYTKTLIRFINRNLSESEIKYLWARFPQKEYPFMQFSPKYPNLTLNKLFRN